MSQWIQFARKYPFTTLLRVFLTVIMIMTTTALVVTLTNSWSTLLGHWPELNSIRNLKQIGTLLAKPAELGLFGAVGYWVLRELLNILKGRPSVVFQFLRKVMLFLKRNHTFIGWVILAAAFSHGAFFIFAAKHSLRDLITGLAALTGLVIVSILGIIFDSKRKKKQVSALPRKWHFYAAMLFVGLFLVHLYL